MEYLKEYLDFVLHFDKHLEQIIQTYQGWTYLLLAAIIFAETGLVFMPFLPGDSLLFAAGVFANRGAMSVWLLLVLLTVAAIVGDSVNYWIGKFLGPRVLRAEKSWMLNKKHLALTHEYFEKYGGKTIIIARFVPIVRTLAPFVAGIGAMTYSKFMFYNVLGGLLWVGVCVFAGYIFGGLPWVKNNFEIVVLAIIFISILPGIVEFLRHRARVKREADAARPVSMGEKTDR